MLTLRPPLARPTWDRRPSHLHQILASGAASVAGFALRALYEATQQEAAGRDVLQQAQSLRVVQRLEAYKRIVRTPACATLGAQAIARLEAPAAESALALARAAATRSCAYLRCANLEGRGGVRAGEGEGSQRCR